MINGIPRILIVRLSSIGDVVRVLPALHALREEHPNAQIDWAVEEKSLDIVSGHPELDKVHVFHRSDRFWQSTGRFLRFCGEVRKCRYDIVLDFHGVFKSGVVTRFSRAPKRYGFAKPRGREGSYLAVNKRVSFDGAVLNRVEENLRLCEKVAPRRDSQQVPCFVPEEIRDEVEEYFADAFRGAKLVVAMHVAMDRPEKQWPVEHFASLSDMLLADGRFDVVLTCGPGPRRPCGRFHRALQAATGRSRCAEIRCIRRSARHSRRLLLRWVDSSSFELAEAGRPT